MNKRILSGACLIVILAACGGDGGSTGKAGTVSDIGSGMSPGSFELTMAGQVVSLGPYQGPGEVFRYWAHNYSGTRERQGYGGRDLVEATNADGPYRIRIRQGLSRNGGDEEGGSVYVQLPPNASAGQTYVIRNAQRARPGEAYAELAGEHQIWRERRAGVEGQVRVDEIGEFITLAFEFHNGLEQDHQQRIDVSGRVFRMPLDLRPEARYSLVSDDRTTDRSTSVMRVPEEQSFTLIMGGTEIYMTFPDPRPRSGRYRFSRQSGESRVGLDLPRHEFDSVDGQLLLTEREGEYFAEFSFATQGSRPVTVTGVFEHVGVP